jgi:transcriptional regulator GlxA family with amidase domain
MSQPIRWTRALRWVDEGHVVTSAGVSAGTDMALYLVQRLFGMQVANSTAQQMEYAWKRDPKAQPTFSPP